jgi:hypothetical protein
MAEHFPDSVHVVILSGQVILGGSQLLTVTVKVQATVFAEPSVAVQVTVVVPCGNAKPEAGWHSIDGAAVPQLSVPVNV